MSEDNGQTTGSRKVKMAAIGGVLTAILGVVEAFTGTSIGVEVYATIGAIFGTAMVGNGMEHIGQGLGARGTDASSLLNAVTGMLTGRVPVDMPSVLGTLGAAGEPPSVSYAPAPPDAPPVVTDVT